MTGKGKTEEEHPTFNWPLETGVYYVFSCLLHICPFWLLIDSSVIFKTDKGKERARAGWVVGWLAALLVLWLWSPLPSAVCVGLAAIRLVEIYVTGLGTLLNQQDQARARNMVTIVAYVLQAILIFAIFGHDLARDSFVANPETLNATVAASSFDFLYISWSNLTSLGNNYVTQSDFAHFLEVFSTTTGIFLLSVLLAFGIDEAKGLGGTGAETPADPETAQRDGDGVALASGQAGAGSSA